MAKSRKPAPPKSRYVGVADAKASRASNYFRPGHYLAQITSIEEGTTRAQADFVAIQFRNLHTFEGAVSGFDHDRKCETGLHTVGEEMTDMQMVAKDVFAPLMKAAAMVLGDLTEDDFDNEEFDGQIIEQMLDDSQPLSGTIVEMFADTVIKKPSRHKKDEELTGKDIYTRVTYRRRYDLEEARELIGDGPGAKFLPAAE